MKKGKIAKNWLSYLIIVFFVTILLTVFAINKTKPVVYELGACTFNNFECDFAAWNGNCTDEIKNQCCAPTVDIRWCSGNYEDADMCSDKYCQDAGYTCLGVYHIAGGYECKCVLVSGPI